MIEIEDEFQRKRLENIVEFLVAEEQSSTQLLS